MCVRFTARGIVAFVFSWVTGILGVLVIGWYGINPVEGSERPQGTFAEAVNEGSENVSNENSHDGVGVEATNMAQVSRAS